MRNFFTALSFLTRIPVPIRVQNREFSSTNYLYPYFIAVGFIIGCLQCILSSAFDPLGESVTAVLLLGCGVLLTGAFHEDGFADVLDSMGVYGSSKKLEVMRDPRVGTFAVCGLIVLFIFRFCTYEHLLGDSCKTLFSVFILSQMWCRWVLPATLLFIPYGAHGDTGKKNLGASLDKPTRSWVMVQGVGLLLITLFLIPYVGLLYLMILPLFMAAAVFYFKKVFNGVTGDCLGFISICSELLFMLSYVIVKTL